MMEEVKLDDMTKAAVGEVAKEIVSQMQQAKGIKEQKELMKSVSAGMDDQVQKLDDMQKQQKKFAVTVGVFLVLVLIISVIGLFV